MMAKHVTVGCKLPNGLVFEVEGLTVTLNGNRQEAGHVTGGYGLTQIDKVFFDAWLAIHAQQPYIKNGVVFAQSIQNSARSQAREQAGTVSELEPLSQENPLPGIARDDEAMRQKG
ncbi:hypothetical protein SGGMMB4_02738 [Sodalis glossinidius str. 'morsitans']|uniref:Uncharacterized protein n=2 Tax=Sodalis glossinidius TaxID=63612 RepID=A0A193QJ26_SODGM|nr:hypothetical protein SGGMMB4_02738 [Sodalis glossinidius str. 'morsitans']